MIKLDLNKKVFNKEIYSKTIDTNFKELGIIPVTEDLSNTISIEDFFDNYNSIFYSIPKSGETNSHEFLIKTSGDYINFEQNNEQILALQEEIASLREENLKKDIKIMELQTNQTLNITGSLNI